MNKKKKVVIIGGGFGGLFTAMDLANDADVTLISDSDHFTFRPLLYEYLSGEVEAWHIAPAYKELFGDEINFAMLSNQKRGSLNFECHFCRTKDVIRIFIINS